MATLFPPRCNKGRRSCFPCLLAAFLCIYFHTLCQTIEARSSRVVSSAAQPKDDADILTSWCTNVGNAVFSNPAKARHPDTIRVAQVFSDAQRWKARTLERGFDFDHLPGLSASFFEGLREEGWFRGGILHDHPPPERKEKDPSPTTTPLSYLAEFLHLTTPEQRIARLAQGVAAFSSIANLEPDPDIRREHLGHDFAGLWYSEDLVTAFRSQEKTALPVNDLHVLILMATKPGGLSWEASKHHGERERTSERRTSSWERRIPQAVRENALDLFHVQGSSAARALDELVLGPTITDCGQYVQLAVLFGFRYLLGSDAAFDWVLQHARGPSSPFNGGLRIVQSLWPGSGALTMLERAIMDSGLTGLGLGGEPTMIRGLFIDETSEANAVFPLDAFKLRPAKSVSEKTNARPIIKNRSRKKPTPAPTHHQEPKKYFLSSSDSTSIEQAKKAEAGGEDGTTSTLVLRIRAVTNHFLYQAVHPGGSGQVQNVVCIEEESTKDHHQPSSSTVFPFWGMGARGLLGLGDEAGEIGWSRQKLYEMMQAALLEKKQPNEEELLQEFRDHPASESVHIGGGPRSAAIHAFLHNQVERIRKTENLEAPEEWFDKLKDKMAELSSNDPVLQQDLELCLDFLLAESTAHPTQRLDLEGTFVAWLRKELEFAGFRSEALPNV